jgi:hypothetical protein
MAQIFTWTLVALGYLVPSLALGWGLRPAADVIARWGRATSSF